MAERRWKSPRKIARTPTFVERPLLEVPRIQSIFDEAASAINETFGTNLYFALSNRDGERQNIFFITPDEMLQLSYDIERAESPIHDYLNQAGLRNDFAHAYRAGVPPEMLKTGDFFYLSSRLYSPRLGISPVTPADKIALSKNACMLLEHLVFTYFEQTAERVDLATDEKMIKKDLKELEATFNSRAVGLSEAPQIKEFAHDLVQNGKLNGLSIKGKGASLELHDEKGKLLVMFEYHNAVAALILSRQCMPVFEQKLKDKFPWFTPRGIIGSQTFEQDVRKAKTRKRLLSFVSDSNPRSFANAYLKSDLAREIARRRQPYRNWRLEKSQEIEKLANLIAQMAQGTALDQTKQNTATLHVGRTVNTGLVHELSELNALIVKMADLMEIDESKERVRELQVEQEESIVTTEVSSEIKKDPRRKFAKERRRLAIAEEEEEHIYR